MRVRKHWYKVPRETVDATSLRTFKASLGGAWSDLTQWKVSQLTAEGWTGWPLKVASNPSHSRIPFLYYFCTSTICVFPPARTHWAEPLQFQLSLLGVCIVTCPTLCAGPRSQFRGRARISHFPSAPIWENLWDGVKVSELTLSIQGEAARRKGQELRFLLSSGSFFAFVVCLILIILVQGN